MTLQASFAALLQLCCSCCSSLSFSKNMYSHAGQILALECLFGGSETLPMHTRALSLFLPPAAPPSFSLSLSLSRLLSHSLSFSLSLCLSVCLSLAPSLSLSLNTQVTTHILSITYVALTCQSTQATSVWGLKLLVYEALSY